MSDNEREALRQQKKIKINNT